MLWVLVLVCALTSVWCGEDEDSRVVHTKQGPIRGYKSPDGEFYAFYGVPYATAPTGSQRFQGPLPPPIRSEIFEAVDKYIVCPQIDYYGLFLNEKTKQKENCLIANIYMPQTEDKYLPVLVSVHGGAFIIGYGNFKTPENLAMTKKAVIVNFNYRLGAHGFLCLGTKDVPGNAGMKDQVALLRWVKDNIAAFGGNPDDVTITGYSAGSASVDLLQLSKMANGLFNKVIPESGASTSVFGVQADPIEYAKNYAKLLNFSDDDNLNALEEFYKTASYEVLTSINIFESKDSSIIFAPCVERETGVERFLEDSPINILKSGNYQKRPMLFGFSTHEGILRVNLFEAWKERMNTKFSDFLPGDLQFKSEEEKEAVALRVKKFYFGTKPVSGDTITEYVDYFTDVIFAYATIVSARLQVEAGNDQVYLYEYRYTDETSPVIPYIDLPGSDHCAQTWAILDGVNVTHSDESIASDEYKSMKRILRDIWLNFVTTGKPVPEGSSVPTWPPAGGNASPYMVLNRVLELKESPLLEKRVQFWDDIYSKYYRYPVPPKTPQMMKTEL